MIHEETVVEGWCPGTSAVRPDHGAAAGRGTAATPVGGGPAKMGA